MPPVPLQYQGAAAIAAFLRHWAAARGARRLRLVPTRANTQPAFGLYLQDRHAPLGHAAGLLVLTLHGDQIAALTCFYDTSACPASACPAACPVSRPRVRQPALGRTVCPLPAAGPAGVLVIAVCSRGQ
jgi:RNA polymerase sigma-70 factor (ECF subfamily)